jgi:hypothetical protein
MTIERFDFFYDTDLSKGLRAYREQDAEGEDGGYEAQEAALAAKDAALATLRDRIAELEGLTTLAAEVDAIRQNLVTLQQRCERWSNTAGVESRQITSYIRAMVAHSNAIGAHQAARGDFEATEPTG